MMRHTTNQSTRPIETQLQAMILDGRTYLRPVGHWYFSGLELRGARPPRTYRAIHLKSNVVLHLEPGATILAAETPMEGTTSGGYDAAEANAGDNKFQDYGHSHWHNSLI